MCEKPRAACGSRLLQFSCRRRRFLQVQLGKPGETSADGGTGGNPERPSERLPRFSLSFYFALQVMHETNARNRLGRSALRPLGQPSSCTSDSRIQFEPMRAPHKREISDKTLLEVLSLPCRHSTAFTGICPGCQSVCRGQQRYLRLRCRL